MTSDQQAWGRWATLGFAVIALLGSQAIALLALTWWYGVGITHMPDFSGDGVAVSVIICVSIPLQLVLLYLVAQRPGGSAADYLGLRLPRRAEIGFGVAATVALIIIGNAVSWLLGRTIVTQFQLDIYRTAAAAGALPLLIYRYALSPYDDLNQQAWAGAFLLVVLVLGISILVRWASRRRKA